MTILRPGRPLPSATASRCRGEGDVCTNDQRAEIVREIGSESDADFSIRSYQHRELLEWKKQAHAARLAIGLLERPIVEKRLTCSVADKPCNVSISAVEKVCSTMASGNDSRSVASTSTPIAAQGEIAHATQPSARHTEVEESRPARPADEGATMTIDAEPPVRRVNSRHAS